MGLLDPFGDTEKQISALAANGTNLFAGMGGGEIFLSTDSATTWTLSSSNVGYAGVPSFAVIGTNVFAGTGDWGVYLSSDSGQNWNPVDSGLIGSHNVLEMSSMLSVGTNIFAATAEGGVYLSTDSGTRWTSVGDGLPPISLSSSYLYVDALAASGGYLYAGTQDTGVWRRPLSEMVPLSSVEQNPATNAENSLRIFPNPATNALQVLGGPSGTARLFDLLGREVLEARVAGGDASPTREMDISHLEDGMYFLRIGNQSTKVEIAH